MCSHGQEETMKHLLFECEFGQMCWASLHIVWDISLSVTDMIEDGRRHFHHSCYMEAIVIASWAIWIHRNNFIFNEEQICFGHWKKEFKDLFNICKHRAKVALEHDMAAWLSSL
jgi:hypothetical protein